MACKPTGRDGKASSAPSSRPSSTNRLRGRWKHDVFLSFHGETRTKFTDHLYNNLKDAGVNVFRDDEGLRRGEEISSLFDAIRGSRVSVVVFSDYYAASIWCLEELATIMECRQALGQLVLPVFYDIHPSDVRRQSGSFMTAFHNHEQRFALEKDTVARWKAAATQAGNLSGWDLRNATYRHEGRTVKIIVRTIMEELNRIPLDLAKCPVGIEPRLEELSSLLKVGNDSDVRFLRICGMGGIGKTTLAKAIYNRFFHYFQGKCFLADVREKFDQPNGRVHLQEQLLSDVLKNETMKLSNIHQGISVIKERLSGMRVLIVLDDVTHSEQLDMLAREHDWFGPGSRIVITTRHLDLLKDIKAESTYMARELNHKESLELFNQHAFRNCYPREELMDLLEETLTYCKGLPLALEVLGSFLHDRTVKEWKSLSRKLKEIPHNIVQKQLRISFDGLGDDKEKDLFLDIACFFVGFDKDYAVKILDGCGLFADIGISVLTRRCLLEIDKNNKLRMHDLIRDMGREIIREKCSSNPGKRSRLWYHEDVLETLHNHLGTEEVEGIALNSTELATVEVNAEAFSRMDKLRILQLNCLQVSGNYQLLSKNLRWLFWHRFSRSFIPKGFSMARMVVLDMQYSHLRQVWEDEKLLKNLKILNLSYSQFLTKTPNFLNLPNIEDLILRGCIKLAEVHFSIGNLRRLVSLNLRNCKKLNKLPNSICRVKSLKTLDISGCPKIHRLPENFEDMESLTEFVAEGTGIIEVPFSVAHMKNLSKVSLSVREEPESNSSLMWSPRVFYRTKHVRVDSLFMVRSLRTLRLVNCGLSNEANVLDGIGNLKFLENLDLRRNQFSSLPDAIRHLTKLERIILDDCTKLEKLPILPPNLFVLSAVNCTLLNKFRSKNEFMIHSEVHGPNELGLERAPRGLGLALATEAMVHMEWCKNRKVCKFLLRDGLERFILREDGFSKLGDIFFQRSDIPDWFDHQASGPCLSFPMSPFQSCRLRRVTICVIYSCCEEMLMASQPPFYRVTIKNRGRTLDLTHQTEKGGDEANIYEEVFWNGERSFAWLLHLPHQIVFRDELDFEGEVELVADASSSALSVERIGIHIGSQVCRHCHSDRTTRREAPPEMRPSGSVLMLIIMRIRLLPGDTLEAEHPKPRICSRGSFGEN